MNGKQINRVLVDLLLFAPTDMYSILQLAHLPLDVETTPDFDEGRALSVQPTSLRYPENYLFWRFFRLFFILLCVFLVILLFAFTDGRVSA